MGLIHEQGDSRETLASDVERAESRLTQARGLMFRRSIPDGYALVGCTTAPAFDFADFELADRATLVDRFPQHEDVIVRLTPDGESGGSRIEDGE